MKGGRDESRPYTESPFQSGDYAIHHQLFTHASLRCHCRAVPAPSEAGSGVTRRSKRSRSAL